MITQPLRAALFLAALFCIAAGLARPARAQDPALTILFTGNTYGNYEPCPS